MLRKGAGRVCEWVWRGFWIGVQGRVTPWASALPLWTAGAPLGGRNMFEIVVKLITTTELVPTRTLMLISSADPQVGPHYSREEGIERFWGVLGRACSRNLGATPCLKGPHSWSFTACFWLQGMKGWTRTEDNKGKDPPNKDFANPQPHILPALSLKDHKVACLPLTFASLSLGSPSSLCLDYPYLSLHSSILLRLYMSTLP